MEGLDITPEELEVLRADPEFDEMMDGLRATYDEMVERYGEPYAVAAFDGMIAGLAAGVLPLPKYESLHWIEARMPPAVVAAGRAHRAAWEQRRAAGGVS